MARAAKLPLATFPPLARAVAPCIREAAVMVILTPAFDPAFDPLFISIFLWFGRA